MTKKKCNKDSLGSKIFVGTVCLVLTIVFWSGSMILANADSTAPADAPKPSVQQASAPVDSTAIYHQELRKKMAASGSTIKAETVSDIVLEQADEIDKSTPLDFRASLATSYYARYTGVRISLVLAVIEQESGFRNNAVSSQQARGYMQLMPATEKNLVKAYGSWLGITYNPKRIYEPEYNIALGAAHLSGLQNAAKGDAHRSLSTYNRGGGSVQRYYNMNQTYATSYSRSVLQREKKYTELNQ